MSFLFNNQDFSAVAPLTLDPEDIYSAGAGQVLANALNLAYRQDRVIPYFKVCNGQRINIVKTCQGCDQ